MRKSPRDRRLNSDHRSVIQLQNESTIFTFSGAGQPPSRYRLSFKGQGLQRNREGEISIAYHHEVLVELGAAYPRLVPNLAWQTPIFHPNISTNGVVCLGGYGTHWVPSLTLDEMCTMLWDMIRYKNFDTESPYNRDAALWAKNQTNIKFPLDHRSIRDRIENGSAASTPVSVVKPKEEVSLEKAPDSDSERREIAAADIEIVETGIEIIESRDGTRPEPASDNDGIIFID